MAKKYRQINNLITESKENLHKAYDRGYAQAKEDYKRPLTTWTADPHESGMQFICSVCKKPAIAAYLYCPNCGSRRKDE